MFSNLPRSGTHTVAAHASVRPGFPSPLWARSGHRSRHFSLKAESRRSSLGCRDQVRTAVVCCDFGRLLFLDRLLSLLHAHAVYIGSRAHFRSFSAQENFRVAFSPRLPSVDVACFLSKYARFLFQYRLDDGPSRCIVVPTRHFFSRVDVSS